jgi:hypothetical protein
MSRPSGTGSLSATTVILRPIAVAILSASSGLGLTVPRRMSDMCFALIPR